MQQSVHIAPDQVINMVEASNEKLNIKDVHNVNVKDQTNYYNVKAATVLGVLQIICGVFALGSAQISFIHNIGTHWC